MRTGDARSGLAADYIIYDDKAKKKACRIRGGGRDRLCRFGRGSPNAPVQRWESARIQAVTDCSIKSVTSTGVRQRIIGT